MTTFDCKYLVVTLLKTKKLWVHEKNGKRFTYWSKYPDIDDIYAAARDEEPPNKKTCKTYAIRMFHVFVVSSDEEPLASISKGFTFKPIELNDLGIPTPILTKGLNLDSAQKSSQKCTDRYHRAIDEIGAEGSDLWLRQEIYNLQQLITRNVSIVRTDQDSIVRSIENLNSTVMKLAEGSIKPIEIKANLASYGFPFQTVSELEEFDARLAEKFTFRSSVVITLILLKLENGTDDDKLNDSSGIPGSTTTDKKKTRKPHSSVSNHFEKCITRNSSTYKFCKKELKTQNATNMKRHLQVCNTQACEVVNRNDRDVVDFHLKPLKAQKTLHSTIFCKTLHKNRPKTPEIPTKAGVICCYYDFIIFAFAD
ncbi:unnamed protein product [Allacma fusca]|uniref:Uncharacterized protein n=1 Tax=Allacma fusca TaxID=39272 RepID=A0A8J2JWG8_9HEXA|nr:unnamed protein product [Allacma fusca]